MTSLPSIYFIPVSTDGGRIARKGFIYQDHVGAKFLLELMMQENDCDIFFENEDDIVVVHKSKVPVTVEMFQVKSNNLISRWSVSQMISHEIIQRSLMRGRCAEDVTYSLITAYDVDDDLAVLKEIPNTTGRTKEKLDGLCTKLHSRKDVIPTNEKGQTFIDWVNTCIWYKYPENITLLEASNLVLLEKMIDTCFHSVLFLDQKQELYQSLLAKVQQASSLDRTTFNKVSLQEWFEERLKETSIPKKGTEKLIEKMGYAGLDNTQIETAKELKWIYKRETLENQYIGRLAINSFKVDAVALLQDLKLKLDAGELEEINIKEGISFHKYCIKKVDELGEAQKINNALARGCMYDITNRCLHRFKKAKP
ncbi:MAG: dsDNA nuclease domain-containing protein [Ferruginibacter sp.]